MNKFKIWYKNPFGKHEFVGSYSNGLNFDLSSGQIYCNGINVTSYYDLLRFTGLKDKNGKEIYEGDIVKAIFIGGHSSGFARDWHTETVRYLEHRGGYYPMTDCEMYRETDVQNVISSIEVIGNIYENPELIK